MSSDQALTRRTLLRVLGTQAVLVGLGTGGGGSLGCGPESEPQPDALEAVVDALAMGAGLGRSYLETEPSEQFVSTLRARLLPEPEASWVMLPKTALARRLSEAIDADFEHDRVVRVEGWLLSRLEARLFALAALRERVGETGTETRP